MINSLSDYRFEVFLEQITPYVNDIDIKFDKKNKDKVESRNEIFRTTEFKPRFDKFLVEKFKIQDNSKFLVPREKPKNENLDEERVKALNYKVILEKVKDTDYKIRKPLTTFQTSGTSYYTRPEGVKFKLIFFSLNKDLLKVLKDNLAEFLAVTNFGKRKNKCYGSFYISPDDTNYKDIDNLELLNKFSFFKKNGKNYLEMNLNPKKNGNFYDKLSESLEIAKTRGKQPIILIRDGEHRKESMAVMKILKKDDKYRLYVIPNFELVRVLKERDLDYNTNKSIPAFDEDIFIKEIKEFLKK